MIVNILTSRHYLKIQHQILVFVARGIRPWPATCFHNWDYYNMWQCILFYSFKSVGISSISTAEPTFLLPFSSIYSCSGQAISPKSHSFMISTPYSHTIRNYKRYQQKHNKSIWENSYNKFKNHNSFKT